MTPLNLEQTLSYLRERMPAPFDLPQLAHLCRTGQLTPLFAYDRYALDQENYDDDRIDCVTFNLSGYLTAPELIEVIYKDKTIELDIAIVYEFLDTISYEIKGKNLTSMKGRKIILLNKEYNHALYQRDPKYSVFSDNDSVTITRNDLLFDLEQLESIAPAGDTQTSQRKNALAHSATDTTAHTPADMVKVPHQSYRTIDRILYALIQLSGADNSEPYSQNNPSLNAKITTILQNDGLPLEYEAVGKWLARANDLKPINKK